MKRLILLAIMGLMAFPTMAQNPGMPISHKNEVSLNLSSTILQKMPAITYERIFAEDLGLGGEVAVALEKTSLLQSFSLTPFLRWYFSGSSSSTQKYASGFYIEVNSRIGAYNEQLDYDNNHLVDTAMNDAFNVGVGMGLGWKYISRGNWVGTVSWQFGRNLISNESPDFYVGGGISIGRRF